VRLPKSVQEIADVIGRHKALYLVGQWPRYVAGVDGKKSSRVVVYVPTEARLTLDHQLVAILGYSDALKICREFGGMILCLANCADIYRNYRDKMVLQLLGEGWSEQQVAATLDITDRYVRKLAKMLSPVKVEKPHKEIIHRANDNVTIEFARTDDTKNNGRQNYTAAYEDSSALGNDWSDLVVGSRIMHGSHVHYVSACS
jgi:hypothetical protein